MSNHPLSTISHTGTMAVGKAQTLPVGRSLTVILLIGSMVTFLAPLARAEKPEDVQRFKQTRRCIKCNLKKANLANAPLTGAFVRETNLKEANLEGADLRFAIFRKVNLKKANLANADLTGAIFRDVNLDGAILTGAQLPLGFGKRPDPKQNFKMPDPKIQLPEKPRR